MTSPSRNEEVPPATSLTRAAADGDLPAVQRLLASGADVDSRNESGQTALMLAALMGHAELVTHLIGKGADANLRDRLGLTALEWATRRGFPEIAQSLANISPPLRRDTPVRKEEAVPASARAESFGARDLPKPEVTEPRASHPESPAAVDLQPQISHAETPRALIPVGPAELYALGEIPKTDATQPPFSATEEQLARLIVEPPEQPPVSTPLPSPPVLTPASAEINQDAAPPSPSSTTQDSVNEDETQPRVPRPIHHEVPLEPMKTAPPVEVSSRPARQLEKNKVPATASPTSPLGFSGAIDDSADVSELRRCPKCKAVYENNWQLYCTHDRTPLIGGNIPHANVSTNGAPAAPVVVWLLIAFVLGASAFAAYRVTRYFYRAEAPAPVAAKPVEAPPEPKKPFFTVGGDLVGTELTVPEPTYPAELQNQGIGGPITVRVRVNQNGRVISTATSRGDSQLRAAAGKAARLATFAPDKLAAAHPRNRVFSGTITYEFTPPSGAAAPPAPIPLTGFSTEPSVPSVPTNTDPNEPVVSSELSSAALVIPSAEYPASAKRAGTEGSVTVTVRVNRKGKVISWRSTPGNSQLRAAAIRAARKATFSSDKLPGTGDVLGSITYTFKP